jgi:1-pyrroline-5-carboxylate dehydrogenase
LKSPAGNFDAATISASVAPVSDASSAGLKTTAFPASSAARDRGYYVQPTIAQLPLDHPLFAQELFLPFLSIGIVDSFDQALREANRSDFGLTGGLFSQDEGEIARFFDEAQAGVLYVNRRTGATTGAWPGVQSFCGWKGSGLTGRGGCGPYYPAQFMREQSHTRMT